MGKTHDDDEVEIDLRELFYALKKRILVILAATCLQCNSYNACSHKRNNTFFTG